MSDEKGRFAVTNGKLLYAAYDNGQITTSANSTKAITWKTEELARNAVKPGGELAELYPIMEQYHAEVFPVGFDGVPRENIPESEWKRRKLKSSESRFVFISGKICASVDSYGFLTPCFEQNRILVFENKKEADRWKELMMEKVFWLKPFSVYKYYDSGGTVPEMITGISNSGVEMNIIKHRLINDINSSLVQNEKLPENSEWKNAARNALKQIEDLRKEKESLNEEMRNIRGRLKAGNLSNWEIVFLKNAYKKRKKRKGEIEEEKSKIELLINPEVDNEEFTLLI